MEQQDWLEDVVIVNESPDERVVGDVSLFRNAGDACRRLEQWWVEDQEGFAFTASGARLILAVDASNNVVVERREACADGTDIIKGWLRSSANAMLEARRQRARQGKINLGEAETRGVLPGTIEGLIAYLGFAR
ncbi:hypothetical protein [Sphingomonas oleivorans]|nr:hypothetical protein [Sphingomonas oleivorans]